MGGLEHIFCFLCALIPLIIQYSLDTNEFSQKPQIKPSSVELPWEALSCITKNPKKLGFVDVGPKRAAFAVEPGRCGAGC